MKNNKGFSLVELIVVIAIMAILAAVAIPTFAGFIGKANESADVSFMNDVEYAVELAYAGKVVDITAIEVEYNSTTKAPIAVKVTIGEDTVEIVEADKTAANVPTEAKDAANTIDWTYKFKAADKVASNDNWSKAPETVWTLTPKTVN